MKEASSLLLTTKLKALTINLQADQEQMPPVARCFLRRSGLQSYDGLTPQSAPLTTLAGSPVTTLLIFAYVLSCTPVRC